MTLYITTNVMLTLTKVMTYHEIISIMKLFHSALDDTCILFQSIFETLIVYAANVTINFRRN